MKRINIRILAFSLALVVGFVVLTAVSLVSAKTMHGPWIEVGAGEGRIEPVDDGILVISPSWYPNNKGVLYNESVDLTNFSFEVTINEIPGYFDLGVDVWYAVALTDQKDYFDIWDPEHGQGVVILLRPWSDGSGRAVFASLLKCEEYATRMPSGRLPSFKTQQRYRFEFEMDDTLGLIVYVNGARILDGGYDIDLSWLKDVFPHGQAYFSFSGAAATETSFTIHQINDQPAVGSE